MRGPPLSLHSFNVLAHSRKIILLLLITILPISGQLIVFVYLAPLLQKLTGASHEVIGLMFALFGVAAFIGNVVATSIVGRLGGFATSVIFLTCTLSGLLLWSFGVGYLPVMGAVLPSWGWALPPPGGARSCECIGGAQYVGQAIGSGVGGVMFGLGWLDGIGFVGVAFVLAGIAIWSLMRERAGVAQAS